MPAYSLLRNNLQDLPLENKLTLSVLVNMLLQMEETYSENTTPTLLFGTVVSTIYDKTFKTAILILKYLISYCGNSVFRERVRTAVRFATARRRRHTPPDFTAELHSRRNRRRGTQKTGPQIRPGTHIRQRFYIPKSASAAIGTTAHQSARRFAAGISRARVCERSSQQRNPNHRPPRTRFSTSVRTSPA